MIHASFFVERMLMDEIAKNIKLECEKYMARHNLQTGYELLILFYKPNRKEDSFAYIIENKENEEMLSIHPFTNEKPYALAEWDYNLDTYDFDNLKDGYEIAYMSINNHYNFWCVLEQWLPNDIECTEGLQKYLDYCKYNGITKEVIENIVGLKLEEDIMKYHKEKNQGYTIIAECNINGKSIVLAKNRNAATPYVTWETTQNRKNGFTAGNYFSSIKKATKDYTKRSKHQLQYALGTQVDLSIKHKKEQER